MSKVGAVRQLGFLILHIRVSNPFDLKHGTIVRQALARFKERQLFKFSEQNFLSKAKLTKVTT